MRSSLPLLALAVLASGCASHEEMREPRSLLQSGLINDSKEAARLEQKLTDKDIAALLDADIRAKVPTKLALAAVSDGYSPYRWGCYSPRSGLSTISAEELQRWEAVVQGVSYIEGVMPVTALSIGSTDLKLHDLRAAAAAMGCELLLLYHVSDSGVDNYTDAAALYWTFVGLWLAPGNLYEHRTVMQAIIVDCRTGAILGTATGDSHLRAACPAAYGEVQEGKLAQEAHQKAMDDLLKACKPVLKAIVTKAAQPRR